MSSWPPWSPVPEVWWAVAVAAAADCSKNVTLEPRGTSVTPGLVDWLGAELGFDELDVLFDGRLVTGTTATPMARELDAALGPIGIDVVPDHVVSASGVQERPVKTWPLGRIDQRSNTEPELSRYRYRDGAAGVRLFVVDTGVNREPDLGDRVDEGWSAVGGDTSDETGHGTHVALVAAGTESGVAKELRIVPVRVMKADEGCASDVKKGLAWILEQVRTVPGRDIVNISLEGPKDADLDEAVEALVQAGAVVVVAAGNTKANVEDRSPAGAARALTVGSVTGADLEVADQGWGPGVDIFGVGGHWWTSTRTLGSGTSIAAPQVAGAVALFWSRLPQLSGTQVGACVVGCGTRVVDCIARDGWACPSERRPLVYTDPDGSCDCH